MVWLTGLSGAGKSTLAFGLESWLFERGCQVCALDGDEVRRRLNADLGFSPQDRVENIRRCGEVAALFADAGLICIAAFISPYRAEREAAREAAGGRFHEVFVKADLATCERRDPKGLYRLAREGRLSNFTGIDDVYEEPLRPALTVRTDACTVAESLSLLTDYMAAWLGGTPPPPPPTRATR